MKTIITLLVLVKMVGLPLTCHAESIDWDRLVRCVIQVESSGNPHAVGKDGEIGLMQISPIVLKEFNSEPLFLFYADAYSLPLRRHQKTDLFCPYINRKIGMWYLTRLHNHYLKKHFDKLDDIGIVAFPYEEWSKDIKSMTDYKVALILSAYNGGITRLRKHNYDISKMPGETREYVVKVMRLYNETN